MVTIDPYAELEDPRRLPLASACTALMARQYQPQFGLDRQFEVDTCTQIAAFLDAFDPQHDAFWIVRRPSDPHTVLGCAAIDGAARRTGRNSALLRWVMLGESLRGRGLGARLLDGALHFCSRRAYRQVTLCTHPRLRAAVHLYETRGFRTTGEDEIRGWGAPTRMTSYALDLHAAAPWPIAAAQPQAA